MENAQVIKSINEIYDHFNIPPNLRMHMLRAAGVADQVLKSWPDKRFVQEYREEIIAALLIHDLGNIVKFKFDGESIHFMGSESRRVDYWKQVQRDTIKKYGSSDDHVVTKKRLEELGASPEIISMIDDYLDTDAVKDSDHFPIKFILYGDCRVGPMGILSVKERLADLERRYRGTDQEHLFKGLEVKVEVVEEQLLSKAKLRPEQINDESVKAFIKKTQK